MNNYLQKVPFSLRLFEFYGLIILYITLRLTHKKYLILLYVAIILGGGFQAIYGIFQLLGYYPSHHELFKMTGSFFNPGPYAGYLAAAFPVSVGLYLFNPPINTPKHNLFLLKLTKYFTIKSLALISIICMCLVLPASDSRAAWIAVSISSVYLFTVKFRLYQRIQTYFDTRTKKIFLLFALLILIIIAGISLYHLRKDSADGRLLIWKVTMNMIRDKPVSGFGFDQFKAHYMDYQATWFEHNHDSEDAMVAGDINYAFNEFLQINVENGVLGLVIITTILFIIFRTSVFRIPGTDIKPRAPVFTGVVAKSGIISILVFGLFSYPSQILTIKTILALYLATVAGIYSQEKVTLIVSSNRKNLQMFYYSLRIMFSIAGLLMLYAGGKSLYQYSKAYRYWNEAHQVYQMSAYEICLKNYEKAWPVLKSNGDFLTGYGKALSMAGRHDKAVNVLLQAADYYSNVVIYTALGDSYKQLGETWHAEHSYLHAWYMNPSRFYPKYLLAKLYSETGQREKALLTANELLRMHIKVPSAAIEEIKIEMQNIILRNKGRN